MKTTPLAVALACALAPFAAHAGQADICYSDPQDAFSSPPPPTNATVFRCPTAGDKTIPQLAAEGWQIGQLVPIMVNASQSAGQLVIQK
ncbi:hypothetical protein ACQQ2N_06315 [Dokdonella sp. MW10]|uniref:hypothetical protein n=1 Tax=Dokdonella sp. MW10 TaxID=2992926 RepID=UPI003F81C66D